VPLLVVGQIYFMKGSERDEMCYVLCMCCYIIYTRVRFGFFRMDDAIFRLRFALTLSTGTVKCALCLLSLPVV
jgi:hypothetical protein